MSDFEDKIGALYNQFATQQKNTKGTKSRADTIENFRGKKGYNDTGIALSSKTIVKQRNSRAGYHYPQHLQNINERRRKDAMARHGITDPDNPFNKKETKPSTQPAEIRNNRSNNWSLPMAPTPRKKNYVYYDNDIAERLREPTTYIIPHEARPKEVVYKSTGKFPKLDEAIAAAKKYRDEQ